MASKSTGKSTSRAKAAPARKSPLPAKTNASRNTKKGRAAMSGDQFGLPAQKKYRIDDAAHARDALGRVAQNGTPAEKKQVQARVARRYPGIAVTKTTAKKK